MTKAPHWPGIGSLSRARLSIIRNSSITAVVSGSAPAVWAQLMAMPSEIAAAIDISRG